MSLRLGTIIELPDKRRGTICWRNLDGEGGVWGEYDFSHIEENFNDELPLPEFMLREKEVEGLLRKPHWRDVDPLSGKEYEERKYSHRRDLECVGEDYEVVDTGKVRE